jgi:hypothetical protein
MANIFNAKFSLAGAPDKPEYVSEGRPSPNAPPIPASGIHSNDLTGRSLRLDFLTHLPDGEYVLDDINAYVGYSEGYEFAATGLSGLIKINLLEGRYEGNYTVTVEDQHTRKWKMEGTIDIQVIPQRKN